MAKMLGFSPTSVRKIVITLEAGEAALIEVTSFGKIEEITSIVDEARKFAWRDSSSHVTKFTEERGDTL